MAILICAHGHLQTFVLESVRARQEQSSFVTTTLKSGGRGDVGLKIYFGFYLQTFVPLQSPGELVSTVSLKKEIN